MSDITYEELTLVCHFVLHNMPPYTLHMSDITYEELTHRLSDVPICMSNSSDITYEELTRLSGIVKVSPFSMKCGRTLPMRN